MYPIAQTVRCPARAVRCEVRFGPGITPSLETLVQPRFKSALAVSALALATQAMAQVAFYEAEGYRGRAFSTDKQVGDFSRGGFNDRASSVVVDGGRWEVCEHAGFNGRCVTLRRGSYDSLRSLGMENRVSSVRRAGSRNVGGAIAGALIGGILGHQVGGGSGKDIATVGGAVAGAVIGANVGTGSNHAGRDACRCENITNGTPAYWDVTYNFRGRDHQVQMSAAPGTTVAVNRDGTPRQ